MSLRQISLISLCAILLGAGCSLLPGSFPPTFIPEEHLPTLIELTAQALVDQGLVTPPPSRTLGPADLTATAAPTLTYTLTTTPSNTPSPTLDVVLATPEPLTLPDPLPQAEIQIISPGRLSRVRSPFNLHLYLDPPRSDRVESLVYRFALYDENGRALLEQTLAGEESEKLSSHLLISVPFDIQGEAQTVRLVVSCQDDYGRIAALASSELILLSQGEAEIKPVQDLFADLILQQPIPSTLIQGEVLLVQGVTRSAPDDQLYVGMIDRDGNQVGSGLVTVSEEDLGKGYRSFAGEVPFQVDKSSWIRVQVIARDGKFSGILNLTSVEVLVSP
jgi:hypothetical protein